MQKKDMMTVRSRLYTELEPDARVGSGLSILNWFLAIIIIASTVVAILLTEPLIVARLEVLFEWIDDVFVSIFAVEYVARIWVAAEREGSQIWRKRVSFVLSPSGLLDLTILFVAIAPFITTNLMVLRLVRLLRIIRLAKLGRMSKAIRLVSDAIAARKFELLYTIFLAIAMLIFGATALYFVEGELQPEKFGSIPRALWWSVVTLTTVGYGDVYPVTVAGKIMTSVISLAGVGLIAMPTGILAAAFSEAVQKERS